MRVLTILLLATLSTLVSHAQISPGLQHELQNEPDNSFHTIRVEFVENVNCFALNHQFKQDRLAVSDRAKTVTTELQNQASLSQNQVFELLTSNYGDQVKNLHSFWIVNLLVLDAQKDAIEAISELPEVALIDLEDTPIIWHDPIIQGEVSSERSPNGVEPGLVAINAPAMWALGYTGRGRLVYDYDTGVWPTHPAFADRFLAHRFPMSQCWYGFFSNEPNGGISDHGTHTLGTIAGLIESTNDTIGVAHKAYWIANDFVTSTVEALPPLAAMMGAFEWALNPDGDVNTTYDIPDVINNSWRWRDDSDTVQCAGPVVSLMNAIEAAGIANVFSGGNSGPGNTSVNAPQRINTSEVNTFSVGAVDGNESFPYPITNFSTRGPSQCPHSGSLSLEIHPEVVAPGQNVRSAWGVDEFNTISGTSMAAPHVSGAILLLKEAFPYLGGEDLLWALYLTAVDMGDPGEDNVYGMGMIDVYAAYQHLSQINTPVDPTIIPWDLAIMSATNPTSNGITCDNQFSTEVVVKNLGQNVITTVNFDYDINGLGTLSHAWSGNLPPGGTQNVVLPAIGTGLYGGLGINILASISGQSEEYDLYNNRWHLPFNRRNQQSLPFTEGFENGFEENDWLVKNEDGATTWDTISTSGLLWSSQSATIQCYSYSPRSSQKDGLISPEFSLPNADPLWLLFDVAYQKRTENDIAHDSLQVLASTDCGETFGHLLYNKGGEELSTRVTPTFDFQAEFETDWRRDSVSLNQFADQNVLMKFETTNRKGNNIFIDNISIFQGNVEPAGIFTTGKSKLKVYPNPTNNVLYMDLTNELSGTITANVYSSVGEKINCSSRNVEQRLVFDTSNLSAGIYTLTIQNELRVYNKRFVKN